MQNRRSAPQTRAGGSVKKRAVKTRRKPRKEHPVLRTIGYVVFIVGLLIGLGIIFFAMNKYNKGIF